MKINSRIKKKELYGPCNVCGCNGGAGLLCVDWVVVAVATLVDRVLVTVVTGATVEWACFCVDGGVVGRWWGRQQWSRQWWSKRQRGCLAGNFLTWLMMHMQHSDNRMPCMSCINLASGRYVAQPTDPLKSYLGIW